MTNEDNDAQVRAKLLAAGWTVSKTSLYDEEAVEGWCWESPRGATYDIIEAHDDEPPVPTDHPLYSPE